MIIATCGHTLTEGEWLGKTVAVKDSSREGTKAISNQTLCDSCFDQYESMGLLLHSNVEEEEWLGHMSKDFDWDDVYEEFKVYVSTNHGVDFEVFEFKRFLKERYKISRR